MVMTLPDLEAFASTPPGGKAHGGCGSCGTGKAAGDGARCGNGLEKIYPTTAVRFGYMRRIGEFSHAPDMKFTCGCKTVISTRRGIEIGEQVSLSCGGCDKSVTREQMRQWVKACGDDAYLFDAGRILREATAGDLAEYARIQQDCGAKRKLAQQLANRHGLPLKIVECEHLFGGERIIFYFTAEERVDFRALVKDLAHEYRTRIEMRQIGARDEARLLADFETCGREVCCKVFLKTLRPISMRMAKQQKATLDPTQVSGRCGRLKCCLRYEHESYGELDKKLPRVGTRIATAHGNGVIINRQILTQLVQLRLDDNSIVTVVREDITDFDAPPPPPVSESPPARREPRRPKGGHRGAPRKAAKPTSDRPTSGNRASVKPGSNEGAGEGDTATKPEEGAPRAGTNKENGKRRKQGRSGKRRRRRPKGPRSGGGGGATPPSA
ncbi:MAG: stage 0 sporulation family protein [Phycisphaerae bacterium]